MGDSEPLSQTIPFDPRFPNQNQTRNCWQNYVDFHRCQKIKVIKQILKYFKRNPCQGEEYEPCQFFKKNFATVCPNAWIEKWDEQRDKVMSALLPPPPPSTSFFRLPPPPSSTDPLPQGAFPANI